MLSHCITDEARGSRLTDLFEVTRLVGEVFELEMTQPDVRTHVPTLGPPHLTPVHFPSSLQVDWDPLTKVVHMSDGLVF